METEIQKVKTGADLVTHSRMQCFKTCRRKHWYKYGLRVRRESGPALRMGSMVHTALDLLKNGSTLDEVSAAIRENYTPLLEAADTLDRVDALELEAEKVWRLTQGWFNRWAPPFVSDVAIVASELPFNLAIANPATGCSSRTYSVAGKIDGICTLPGRVLLLEHKTAGESIGLDAPYWNRIRLDTQITLYMLAARKLGYPVSGVFYDMIRKPSIAPKLVGKGPDKHRENVQEYGERLAADIAARPEFYYARKEIPRLNSELDEMAHELWQIAIDMRQAELKGHHFKNSGACASPYPCEFLEVCANRTDLSVDPLPEGFERLDYVHPELKEDDNATTDTTDTAASENESEGGAPGDNGQAEVVYH